MSDAGMLDDETTIKTKQSVCILLMAPTGAQEIAFVRACGPTC